VKKDTIGKNHEFHNKEYVLGWADKFEPKPERLELFNAILSELQKLIPENGLVVELGIGPGYLASHILEAMSSIEYFGIDRPNARVREAGRISRYLPQRNLSVPLLSTFRKSLFSWCAITAGIQTVAG